MSYGLCNQVVLVMFSCTIWNINCYVHDKYGSAIKVTLTASIEISPVENCYAKIIQLVLKNGQILEQLWRTHSLQCFHLYLKSENMNINLKFVLIFGDWIMATAKVFAFLKYNFLEFWCKSSKLEYVNKLIPNDDDSLFTC